MFARVTHRRLKPGSSQNLKAALAGHVLPDPTAINGFKAFYVLDTGEDQWATISIFEDKQGLDAWTDECVRVFANSPVKSLFLNETHDMLFLKGDVKHAIVA
jgi:heme-degrading monooxygenase HmoA